MNSILTTFPAFESHFNDVCYNCQDFPFPRNTFRTSFCQPNMKLFLITHTNPPFMALWRQLVNTPTKSLRHHLPEWNGSFNGFLRGCLYGCGLLFFIPLVPNCIQTHGILAALSTPVLWRPGRDRQWGLVLKWYGSNPSGIVLPASLRRYCIDILWCSINTRKCSLTRRECIRRWMLLEDFLRFFEDWTGRTSAVINTTCIDCEQVSLPACLLQWWWMFCLCSRLTFAFRNPDGFYCNAIRGSS